MFGRLRWGSSDAFGSAFLGLSLWELCFSLVPPLWESCWGGGGGGGGWGWGVVHALRRTPCFPSVFLPLSYTSLLLFSFLLSFWLHRFLICFFFFLSPLSPSFFPLLLLLVFFLLCLSPLSPFPLFFFLKSTTFSSIPLFFFF